MIFDTIKYGTFTTDDFINAHTNNDFSKFTSLPTDLRKQFISGVIDLYTNKENNNFKQAVFDYIDKKKINEKQFRNIWGKYWMYASTQAQAASVAVVVATVAAEPEVRAVAVMGAHAANMASVNYYLSHFKKHASYLNKLIQEYQL